MGAVARTRHESNFHATIQSLTFPHPATISRIVSATKVASPSVSRRTMRRSLRAWSPPRTENVTEASSAIPRCHRWERPRYASDFPARTVRTTPHIRLTHAARWRARPSALGFSAAFGGETVGSDWRAVCRSSEASVSTLRDSHRAPHPIGAARGSALPPPPGAFSVPMVGSGKPPNYFGGRRSACPPARSGKRYNRRGSSTRPVFR